MRRGVFIGGAVACLLLLFAPPAKEQVIQGGGGAVITSQNFDILFGTTQGSIIERGSGGWRSITPGAVNLPWVSNGPAADPSYQTLTGAGIANATVTGTNIAATTITGSNVAASTITGGNIASATVTGSNIASATVANANLANMAAGTVKCNQNSGAAPQDCSPVAADKIIYVSTGGNDSNSGLNPLFPKLTLQAAQNAANPNGVVNVGAGTYTLTSTLAPQPGVWMTCAPGTTITQGSAQNLAKIIDFSVNVATGATIERCLIDGNRANNTDSLTAFCIYGGATNNLLIRNNTIQNCSGYGIDFQQGQNASILYNTITNVYVDAISQITGVPSTGSFIRVEGNRILTPIGQHAITITNADFARVLGNSIFLGPSVNSTVNTSGTTISFASGTNFANVSAGQFAVLNSGQEFLITVKNSNTSLTTATTLPTLTNTAAVIGTGDVLQIDSSSFAIVANNVLDGGVTQGIGVSTTTGSEIPQKNLISNNTVTLSGEMCIGVQIVTGSITDTQIVGNNLSDCGQSVNGDGGGAINAGIQLIGATITNTFIDGNYIRDTGGGTVSEWLAVGGQAAGSVVLGINNFKGTINNGVVGDVTSITLSAGWGTGATTSGIVSLGTSVSFTINTGTSPSAGPAFTVNKITTVPGSPVFPQCKQLTGATGPQLVFGEQNSLVGQWVGFFSGAAPSASSTYQFLCSG